MLIYVDPIPFCYKKVLKARNLQVLLCPNKAVLVLYTICYIGPLHVYYYYLCVCVFYKTLQVIFLF